MHAPILVTPAEILPVSLDEARAYRRLDAADDDAVITGLIAAATAHLDGWTGVLGRCLVEQVWRQDFDAFARCLPLPLGPVIEISTVTWRNKAGQIATVASSSYSLRTDAGGRSVVRFRDSYALPSDLHEIAAVSVTYRAGYENIPADAGDPPETPATPARATVPEPIKTAILLLAGHWYENREAVVTGTIATALPMSVDALIAPYRRVGI